jgi:hypothetical protein
LKAALATRQCHPTDKHFDEVNSDGGHLDDTIGTTRGQARA